MYDFLLKLFLILTLVIIISSCAISTKTLTITPVSESNLWKNGVNFAKLEKDSIIVEIGFDGINRKSLMFMLSVENNKNKSFDVIPEDISITYIFNDKYYDSDSLVFKVKDGNKNIQNIDKMANNEQNRKAADDTANLLCCILGGIADIHELTDGKEDNKKCDEEESKSNIQTAMENWNESDERHDRKMQNLERERDYYKNNIWSRHTLFSGEKVSKKILSHFNKYTDIIRIDIKLDEKIFHFDFTQTRQ